MFITNERASFHLRRKENVVKHQKASKYYENDCLQKIFLLFMSLLTVPVVKNSHIEAGISFMLLKNVQNKLERLSIPSLDLSEKSRNAVSKESKS